MAEKDNWLMLLLAAGVAAVIGFFALGKSVSVQAGQAKVGCGCGG